MKYQNILLSFYFLCALLISACTKDDNEPMPQSAVSRLYVSNADTDAAVLNTMIFDPADGTNLSEPYTFDSKLPDGNGIVFDPFSGTVYQVSRQSKNVRTLTVNTDGKLTAKGSFSDESLTSAREIAFDRSSNRLYIASNSDSAIYVYNSANTLTGTVIADKKLKLNGQPWGIHLNGNNLFVVIDDPVRAEVQLFENISEIPVGTAKPSKTITVAGAKRLHGITYSSSRNAMILTAIGEATAPGFNSDGAIYLIDSVATRFTDKGPIVTPIRTISGSNTVLGNPVDVSWDTRTGKDLIYIAEKANREILVFKFTDDGNVIPAIRTQTLATTPEAIYLDAR